MEARACSRSTLEGRAYLSRWFRVIGGAFGEIRRLHYHFTITKATIEGISLVGTCIKTRVLDVQAIMQVMTESSSNELSLVGSCYWLDVVFSSRRTGVRAG
jgi:hypothetical protein